MAGAKTHLSYRQSEHLAAGRLDRGFCVLRRHGPLDARAFLRRLSDRRRSNRHRLHHVLLVGGRDQGSAWRRPYAGRPASPALRHDPVHRLRSDVLRRLVLGLFRGLAVPRDGRERGRRLAARGHACARSARLPAAQHVDLALLGLHRHLGAPCADQRPSRWADQGPVVHDPSRPALHQHSGL